MFSSLLPLLLLTPSDVGGESMRAAVAERFGKRDRLFSPGPTTLLMPRFVYVRDSGLELPFPPWQTDAAYAEAFEISRRGFHEAQPDGARALVVFTSFHEGGNNLFYVPLANDVLGLGDTSGARIFDSSPGSSLDGYVWMGSLDRLEEAGEPYFREAFLHEIAHRWGSYAAVAHADLPRDALRGRQSTHWSFLLDRERSPMDGNDWVMEGDDALTVFSDPPELAFSPLDLYLMGVLPPERVPPFQVITGFSSVSPPWLMVTPSTPPAHRTGAPVTLFDVRSAVVTIDDVIAASGPRSPSAAEGPVVWPIGVVFLSNGFATPTLADFELLDRRIAELTVDFERATGGRMILDVRVRGAGELLPGASCPSLDDCDRTLSDACAPPAPGEDAICTRTCQTEAVCAPGQCCAAGLCIPSRYCGPITREGDDGGTSPQEPTAPPGSLVLSDAQGCKCSAAHSPETSPLALLVLLGFSRAIRANRRRRTRRGSPCS